MININKKYSHTINLENLNDIQKVWLTQLPYINLTNKGIAKIKKNGLLILNLDEYIDNPNAQMYGNIFGNNKEKFSKNITDKYVGRKNSIITKMQLLQTLKELGLEKIRITNILNDSKTGFQAIAFKDSFENTGISYRGSDFEWHNGGLKDWALADVGEFLTNDSIQIHQAIEFFDQNKNQEGNNYIYGHSLGGNLTAHTYLHRHNFIKQAFSYNGLPISQNLLNTRKKRQAFNNPKFICAVVGGDIFQHIKEDNLYANKIFFIKNNKKDKPSWLSAHIPQANSYDKNGNFIRISRQEAWEEMSKQRQMFSNVAKNVNNLLGEINNKQVLNKKT